MQPLRSVRNGSYDLCSALSKSCLMSSPLPHWEKPKLCGETLYKSLLERSSSSLASNAQGCMPDMWAKKHLEMDFPVPAVPAARYLSPFQAYMSSQLKTHYWETDKAIPTIPFRNPWSTESVIMGSLFYSSKCEVGLLCSNNTGIQRKYFISYKSVHNLAPAYLFNICSNFLLTPYIQTNQVLFSDPTINQCIFTH